jgi:hypothetical protein
MLLQMSQQTIATRRRTFAILKVVCAILFWISLGASTCLFFHYEHTRPNEPNPFAGRIYPEHQIGVNFYLTSSERNLLRGLTAGGFICFFLAAACYRLEKHSGPTGVP